MRRFTLIACAVALCAQTPPLHTPQQQPAGLETDWDIAAALQEIGAHAARLLPELNRIDARSSVDQGASETYAEQLQAAKDQTQSLAEGAKTLAKNPERLPVALQLYFRMQGIDAMLTSVEEGMRKYQAPASAQGLASLQAEAGANRDRLQRYIVNLAAEREQELRVMDQEAQRCRAALTRPSEQFRKEEIIDPWHLPAASAKKNRRASAPDVRRTPAPTICASAACDAAIAATAKWRSPSRCASQPARCSGPWPASGRRRGACQFRRRPRSRMNLIGAQPLAGGCAAMA